METFIKKIIAKSPEVLLSKAPSKGHQQRFLKRLAAQQTQPSLKISWRKKGFYFMAFAASITLLFGVFQWGAYTKSTLAQIEAIAPEATQVNKHYSQLVASALHTIETAVNPITQPHVDKALLEINRLENDYKKMQQSLIEGGNTKLILKAMIQNYTTRIELLEEVINQIETINIINQNTNETI